MAYYSWCHCCEKYVDILLQLVACSSLCNSQYLDTYDVCGIKGLLTSSA